MTRSTTTSAHPCDGPNEVNALMRFTRWALWAGIVAGVTVLYFRSATTAEVTQLRKQVAAMDEQIRRLSGKTDLAAIARQADTPSSRGMGDHVTVPDQREAGTPPSTDTVPETGDDQALFAELLTRAGMPSGTVRPEDLRPPPAAVAQVSQRLMETFSAGPLSQHAFVTYSGCTGSGCAIEVNFSDARAAIEQEAELMRWLSDADSSCSFTLDPVALEKGEADIVRHVSIDCGG
jgi:hypothetical protein